MIGEEEALPDELARGGAAGAGTGAITVERRGDARLEAGGGARLVVLKVGVVLEEETVLRLLLVLFVARRGAARERGQTRATL